MVGSDGFSDFSRDGDLFRRTFEDTMLLSPSFTLRGGTREILRGVIARGLGLR